MPDVERKSPTVLHIAAAMNGAAGDVAAWLRGEATIEHSGDLYRGLARVLREGASYDAVLLCLDWFASDAIEFVRMASTAGHAVYVYGGADGGVVFDEALGAGACSVIDPEHDDPSVLRRGSMDVAMGAEALQVGSDSASPDREAPVRVPWRVDPDRPVRQGPGGNGRDATAGAKEVARDPDGSSNATADRTSSQALLTDDEIRMLLGEDVTDGEASRGRTDP